MSAESGPDPRPRLALRMGITGHRDISTAYAENSAAIRSQIAVALAAIRDAVNSAAASAEGGAYRGEPPLLRMISPLAEGADRLAAEEASRLGYRLLAPLPFAQPEYEKDFETEESKSEFRRLLARADAEEGTIALDGGRGKSTGDQSYYAVGRFVVRSADVMIAVWQRDRPAGLGGTGDIVTFALRTGVPVLWIPADAPAAMRLLVERDALELPMPSTADALADLANHVKALLEPPAALPEDEALPVGIWRGLRGHLRRLPYKSGSPLQQFYDERLRPSKGPMLAFDRFRKLFSLPQGGSQRRAAVAPSYTVRQALTPPQLAKIAAYERIRDRADAVALFYSHCHRSTFLALFVLGAAALTCAGLAFAVEPGWPFVLLEIASLGAIGGLVAMDRIRRWHDRWIDYRILAELMRQMAYLVLLGRTLPINRAAILSTHGARTARRQDWVLWYFSAVVREIGVPAARYETEYLHSVRGRFVDGLLAEQIEFHELSARRAGTVARRLGTLGLLCFAGTFLAALAKIAVLVFAADQAAGSAAHRAIEGLGVLGVALPALSAAAFALRAQAEFEIVAKNSERLRRRLQRVAERLTHLPLAGPLSTERLVEEIYGAGGMMIADVEDWVALFDVKTVELS